MCEYWTENRVKWNDWMTLLGFWDPVKTGKGGRTVYVFEYSVSLLLRHAICTSFLQLDDSCPALCTAPLPSPQVFSLFCILFNFFLPSTLHFPFLLQGTVVHCFILVEHHFTCAVPGKKPGTSTKVKMGILKQSRKRTKRAALIEESMSRQPAKCPGLLATTCHTNNRLVWTQLIVDNWFETYMMFMPENLHFSATVLFYVFC